MFRSIRNHDFEMLFVFIFSGYCEPYGVDICWWHSSKWQEYFRNTHYIKYYYILDRYSAYPRNRTDNKLEQTTVKPFEPPFLIEWDFSTSLSSCLQPEPATDPPSALVPFLQKYAEVSNKKQSVSISLRGRWTLLVTDRLISVNLNMEKYFLPLLKFPTSCPPCQHHLISCVSMYHLACI